MVAIINDRPRPKVPPLPCTRSEAKPHTPESRLKLSGFRYYDPELGRWVNRDPLGERGGTNIYASVGNNLIGTWDLLGLRSGCQVIIWAGHYSAAKDELESNADDYIEDICTRHAALTCWGKSKLIDTDNILPLGYFVQNHPPIDIKIGGSATSSGSIPGWQSNVELSELNQYYMDGMTWVQFNVAVADATIAAARAEAQRLANYRPAMNMCCCKDITIVVKRKWNWFNNPFGQHPDLRAALDAVEGEVFYPTP
ncbi:MAG: hypothetical protein HN919_06610 [Verrucomicrobia bacterium]|jgi:RHS repeat-associated protein|nr:hypothetical protein [Verrucomicrobiota bacterium]